MQEQEPKILPAMQDCPAHARIDALEHKMQEHGEILTKTELVLERIEINTKELVVLFEGAKAMRRFVLWVAPLAALAAVFVVAWIQTAK